MVSLSEVSSESENQSASTKSSYVARKRMEIVKNLQALADRNGYHIIQINGQRIYEPSPSSNIKIPSKGCEVFIGNLPKFIYEDELIPLFEQVGPIYKFRMMLDFSERTRGYAFASYFTPKHAQDAVILLDQYEIRPNARIGVYKSIDNRRLFVGCIPTDKTRHEVKELLERYVDGIVNVIMYQNWYDSSLNRGFVFVEFENHVLASIARRQFNPQNLIAWGQPLYVDWADPIPDVDPSVMAKVTVLYLKNIPVNFSSEELHRVLNSIVGRSVLKRTYKMHNYAFVHFKNRGCAEDGKEKLEGLIIDGQTVQIEWARPREFSKRNRLSTTPSNFCTSVPPIMRRIIRQQTREGSTVRSSNSHFSDDSSVGSYWNESLQLSPLDDHEEYERDESLLGFSLF